ncbi:hypothetical protein IFM89_001979 [Coptis chinensis]|uniref:Glucose-methanol-choline oxidoreductase N-terminal domain-containing protein n=1 Tax=Coptis chinensis TaxID=261450 RepID=A0A835HKD6_9MAGN|nr:hypothetical protein IFM89_001979 [Coptis chinensis]
MLSSPSLSRKINVLQGDGEDVSGGGAVTPTIDYSGVFHDNGTELSVTSLRYRAECEKKKVESGRSEFEESRRGSSNGGGDSFSLRLGNLQKYVEGEQVALGLASLVEFHSLVKPFKDGFLLELILLRNWRRRSIKGFSRNDGEKKDAIDSGPIVVVTRTTYAPEGIILDSAESEGDVVLSAGAMGSPQILMLSGIGPSELLSKFNIAPMIDAPHVGQDIRDHPGIKFLLDAGIGNVPPAQSDPSQVVGIASSSRFLFQYGGGSKTSARPRRVLLGKLAYPSSKGKLELNSTDPKKILRQLLLCTLTCLMRMKAKLRVGLVATTSFATRIQRIGSIVRHSVFAEFQRDIVRSHQAFTTLGIKDIDLEDESIDVEILNSMVITNQHFTTALGTINPSLFCEAVVEVPNVTYKDIAEIGNVKRELKEIAISSGAS